MTTLTAILIGFTLGYLAQRVECNGKKWLRYHVFKTK